MLLYFHILIMLALYGQIYRLQVLHNSLARTILAADIRTPVNDLMDALEWVKLDVRWQNQLLLLVFKCLKNLVLHTYVLNLILCITGTPTTPDAMIQIH